MHIWQGNSADACAYRDVLGAIITSVLEVGMSKLLDLLSM